MGKNNFNLIFTSETSHRKFEFHEILEKTTFFLKIWKKYLNLELEKLKIQSKTKNSTLS